MTDPQDAPDVGRRSGEQLGRVRLGRLLGEGGFGVVYEGVSLDDGRLVAVKLLHAHLGDVRDVARRFQREADTMRSVRHPHVVEVLDAGRAPDGTPFFVMERLVGESLAARLERTGPMRLGDAVAIVEQLLDALTAVHAASIVHRDLKPDNVFLVAAGGGVYVKLLDFGVAKIVDADLQQSTATRTGTAIGTAYYMAPEQAEARKDIDARVDLYAVGVILFRMLSGQHPFDADSFPLLIVKVCTAPPPSLARVRPDLPREVVALVDRLLAKAPADRPGSAAEVRASLLPFLGVTTEPVVVPMDHDAAVPLRVDSPLAHAHTLFDETSGGLPERPRGGLRPMLLAGGLAAFGALGFAIAARQATTPPPAPAVELPRPRAAETRVGLRAGDVDLGFAYVNPRPRAMPTLLAVAAAGDGRAAFVGRKGGFFQVEAGRVTRVVLPFDGSLHGVAALPTGGYVTVGERGRAFVVDGDTVTAVPTSTDVTLRAVLVLPSGAWIVAGDRGTLLRVEARRASPIAAATEDDLLALARDGDSVVYVGARGAAGRLRDHDLTAESTGVSATLRAVASCGGRTYVGGDDGTLLVRAAEGGRYERIAGPAREVITGLSCRGRHVLASSGGGSVFVIEQRTSVRLELGDPRGLFALAASGDAATFAVGQAGLVAGVGPDRLVRFVDGPTRALRSVAAVSGALVAVGLDGAIVREGEHGFEVVESPVASGLADVVATGPDTALAVGDLGVLLELTYAGARRLASPTEENLRAVVAEGPEVLAVGEGGVVLRGALDALGVDHVADGMTLRALAGTPSDALAVGDGGTVLSLRAGQSTRIDCGLSDALHAVVRVGDVAYAVGDGGVFARIEGGGCTVERRGGRALLSALAAAGGEVLAVGEGGAAVLRDAAGRHRALTLDSGTLDVHGALASAASLVLVGDGGLVLRAASLRP